MTAHTAMLFLAQLEDFGSLLFWLFFIILPLLGRLVRWLQERATGGKEAAGAPGTSRRRDPRPVEDRGAAEDDEEPGADLWRRLLQGEGPSESSPRVPEPAPRVFSEEALSLEGPSTEPTSSQAAQRVAREPQVADEDIFDRPLVENARAFSGSPSASSLRGEATEPLVGLSSYLPSALGSVSGGLAEPDWREGMGTPVGSTSVTVDAEPPGRDALRRALLWSVILDPPVGLGESPGAPGALGGAHGSV